MKHSVKKDILWLGGFFAVLALSGLVFAQENAGSSGSPTGQSDALGEWALLEKEYKALRADRDNILAQVRVAYDERNKAVEESRKVAEKSKAVKAQGEQLKENLDELKRMNEQLEDKIMSIEFENKDLAAQVASMQMLNKTLAEENQNLLSRPTSAPVETQIRMPQSVMRIAQERDKLIRENADLHYNLGVMLSKSGDYKNAALEFQRATQLRPTDAAAFFNLGKLYADYLPEKEKAVDYFKTYLRLQPQAEDSGWVRTFIATFKASRAEEKLF